ncbi:MAG TPA: alkaline phosphatase family protein [Rhizomicrobium sp.]|jgi:arylsulfatase A-like enzyme
MRFARLVALALVAALSGAPALAASAQHNVVLFIADGLRYSSVTPQTAPTMWKIKTQGVDFTNSHSIYPTVTTANASAIATGHYLGDTGDYGNVLYTEFPVQSLYGSQVVFLESDAVLREMHSHFGEGYLGQQSLLSAARAGGYMTAVVGKTGPTAIQDIAAMDGKDAIIFDDMTGKKIAPDGSPSGAVPLKGSVAFDTAFATGLESAPLTATPNVVQQDYLVTAVTRAILPYLKEKSKPFVLVFWSRDPDSSQHAAIDSLGKLVPGINSETAKDSIRNADNGLKAILDAVARSGAANNTDVFVTADHGFSTISKTLPEANGAMGSDLHPTGFLAIDISKWLNKPLFDPDQGLQQLDYADAGEYPSRGNGMIGTSADTPDAIVAANGGSDFIYVRGANPHATAKRIFDKLLAQPYTGGLFVNDALLKENPKDFAGALPMSAINMIGSSTVPQPSIVVGFRSFVAKGCKLGEQLCTAEMADTSLQTGQGMHGSFSRADTRNFMAAMGPDFKAHFADPAPVSNADISPTLAHILGVATAGAGNLKGRVASEALRGGQKTVLNFQQVGGTRYFDAAGFPGRTVGLSPH